MHNTRLKAYLFLILTSLIWGLAAPIIKFTINDFPPSIFLMYRFGISAVIALIAISIHPPLVPRDIKSKLIILLYAFLQSTAALGLLFLGVKYTTVISATLLSAISPVIIALAGALFLKEHITHNEKMGIFIAFLGTIITSLEPIISSNSLDQNSIIGNIFILLALFVTVATSILAKIILRKNIDAGALSHISFLVGFLSLTPIVFLTVPISDIYSSFANAHIWSHLGVIYMAIVSGTIGYTLYHRGQKSIEVSEAGIFTYLQPLWAIPISILWLGESFSKVSAIGAFVTAFGIILAEYRKFVTRNKYKKHKKRFA